MFLKFKKGKQKELVLRAIKKAGTERNLGLILDIPKSSFYKYKLEITNLPKIRAKKLADFLNIDFNKLQSGILMELPEHWGRKKGGISLIQKKISKNELTETIRKLSKGSSIWHQDMKLNHPKKYYLDQYNKFKKIGGYKVLTISGVKVRNKLEKEVFDFLHLKNINFQYEPYLRIKDRVFFPDFLLSNIIIECTFWNNPTKKKLNHLKTKIKNYEAAGYRVVFFIPENRRKFYKQINSFVVSGFVQLYNRIAPP